MRRPAQRHLRRWLMLPGLLCAMTFPNLVAEAAQEGPGSRGLRPTPRKLSGLPGTLKLDLSKGIPLIEARLGDQPLRLVLDTGASWSLLRPDVVKRLALPTREAQELKARDAAGEVKGVQAASIEKLVLPALPGEAGGAGEIALGDFDVIVMESAVVAAADADGILGLPLLRRMVARFDFAAETVELGGEELPAVDGRSILPLTAVNGLAAIEVTFAGPGGGDDGRESGGALVTRNLLVDTGFSGLLHLSQAAVKDLEAEGAVRADGVTATAHREREFQRVQLDGELRIGKYRVPRPVASVLADARAGHAAMGTGLLRHFTVTIDLPRRRIRLEADEELVKLQEIPGLPSDDGE